MTPNPRSLTVFQAIPKGDRADLAVEPAHRGRVSRIVPWSSQRTVANWTGKSEAKRERWQRWPVRRRCNRVAPTCRRRGARFAHGVGRLFARGCPAVVVHILAAAGPLTVVVGPEGGLAPEEVETLTGRGAVALNLGTLIMRTSTAGAAACVAAGPRTVRGVAT